MGSSEDGVYSNEMRTTMASTVGGVMTEEVGAVRGDLEIATRPKAEGIEVTVRYVGADEWYTVDGSPIESNNTGDLSPAELRELHKRVVRQLTTPGKIVDGNEESTSLLGFSPVDD